MIPLFIGGQPSRPLLRLLDLTGVVHDGTPTGILDATQQSWSQKGVHQGRIEERLAHLRENATSLFEQLGFTGEQLASKHGYRYALVGGAFQLAIKKRMALLLREWRRGVRFKQIVLLGGERPRAPDKESLEQLNAEVDGLVRLPDCSITIEPANELEIMVAIFWAFQFPEEWYPGHATVCAPRVPDRPKPDPTGEETILHWLSTYQPEPGPILLVYSQPGLPHMQRLARRVLEPLGFQVDVIGYAPTGVINVTQILDSVAKAIYEEVGV